MLSSLILVFREVLEAALIVSIVAAATRSVTNSRRWISAGVAAGVLAACLVALLAGRIGEMAEGVGLELFNAAVLICAVLMIAWHVIWMARHGRELTAEMQSLGRSVSSGQRSLWAMVTVVGLAVLREGSEIVLFLYGLTLGGAESGAMLLGSGLGLLAGAIVGYLLYRGLVKIPMRHFFSATNALLILLASGLAAQAMGYLNQADLVPSLGDAIWDTSGLLSEQSLLGQTLHTLIGYQSRPMGVQILAYAITALSLFLGMNTWGSPSKTAARP